MVKEAHNRYVRNDCEMKMEWKDAAYVFTIYNIYIPDVIFDTHERIALSLRQSLILIFTSMDCSENHLTVVPSF